MVKELLKRAGFAKPSAANRVVRFGLRPVSQLRWIAYDTVKRLPIGEDFSVRVPGHGAFRYRSFPGDEIGPRLYWQGLFGWSEPSLRALLALAPQISFMLDIGANTGVISLVAAAVNPKLRCLAFEPSPRIVPILRHNIGENRMEGRCEVRHEAVGDQCGSAPFRLPLDSSTTAGFAGGGHAEPGDEIVQVPVVTVDSVIPPGRRVDFVKIDVEGFEDRVLAGMRRVLMESRPILMVECLPDGPFREVERILTDLGYRFTHLHKSGPRPAARIEPDPTRKDPNFLCTPIAGG